MTTTSFDSKLEILAHLFLNYSGEEELKDFMEYNDIGLPLAYATHQKMATPTDKGIPYIEEAFDLLLGALGVEDTGFENWDSIEAILSN